MSIKTFITGGSGFIGKNLIESLIKAEHEVTVYDINKIEDFQGEFNFIEGDILDLEKLTSSLKNQNYVFHLAAIADIEESKNNPIKTINANIIGTTNLLEASIKNKVERFMFGSSMYVYNNLGSFYGLTKKISEMLIETYSNEYNLNYTFLRYGSLYGPYSQKWNALYRYVKEIIENDSIKYLGTGNETREYIHIFDAIKLSIKCMSQEYVNKAVIISGQQVLNSKHLLELIFEVLDKDPKKIIFESTHHKKYHYNLTPYKYDIKTASRLIPNEFIDIGAGIIELVNLINQQKK